MARICSTFKLKAIYLKQKGKLLSWKDAKGTEERCSCNLKKQILSHLLLERQKSASLVSAGHSATLETARCPGVPEWQLTFIGKQSKHPRSPVGNVYQVKIRISCVLIGLGVQEMVGVKCFPSVRLELGAILFYFSTWAETLIVLTWHLCKTSSICCLLHQLAFAFVPFQLYFIGESLSPHGCCDMSVVTQEQNESWNINSELLDGQSLFLNGIYNCGKNFPTVKLRSLSAFIPKAA